VVTGESSDFPFTLLTAETLIGGRVHLLPGDFRWGAPYVGLAGVLGFQYLSLTGAPTGTTPEAQSSGYSYGYEFSVGVQLGPRAVAEVQMRSSKILSLGGFSGLSIGGMAFSVGYSW
jgi:hypothetical protein